jgi:bis(5'-nucleosyl)-tetraphosphatase (symmetrical)
MASYAIGDIQGCYQSFRKLLNKIDFIPTQDKLLLAGDLINRGSQSLETMHFILENQSSIQVVLGNHDLHFLAVAKECHQGSRKDTFRQILQSNLKQDIIEWLSKQPLAYYDGLFDTLVVHAGLYPHWSVQQAIDYSLEVSNVLQSTNAEQFLKAMYGNLPELWSEDLTGNERLRFITNSLTRMRYCHQDGRLDMIAKFAPADNNSDLLPWYQINNPHFQGKIIFGHWAALQGQCPVKRLSAIDTGCVWGGQLTALRLDDGQLIQVNSVEN